MKQYCYKNTLLTKKKKKKKKKAQTPMIVTPVRYGK